MNCIYRDKDIEIYTMLSDEKMPLTYHYQVYSDKTGDITHVDIRKLKAYNEINPSRFDLISKKRNATVAKIITLAIEHNEIDFSKEDQEGSVVWLKSSRR